MFTTIEEIAESLKQIASDGGDGNFVIIQFGMNYYLQCAQVKGDAEILCEAVSNYYLPEEDHLDKNSQDKLIALGWSAYVKGYNHTMLEQNCTNEDHLRLAQLLIQTANEVYECFRLKIAQLYLE